MTNFIQFNKKQLELLEKLYLKDRLSLQKIAIKFGLNNKKVIIRHLKQLNIKIRTMQEYKRIETNKILDSLDNNMIKDYYLAQKLSLDNIVRLTGIKRHYITRKLKELNISLRTRSENGQLVFKKFGNPAKRPEVKAKMSKIRKGRKLTPEWKEKIRQSMKGQHVGKNNPAYIDGRTPIKGSLFNSEKYKQWRLEVFKRDNFTCQLCGNIENLESHHKIEFHILLEEFLLNYNYLDSFIEEEKKELLKLGLKWDKFWEIDNGITYCRKCHKEEIHTNYNLTKRTT